MAKNQLQKSNTKAITKSSLQLYSEGLQNTPMDVKSCKVCQSQHRLRGEAEFDKTNGSVNAAYTLLKHLGEDVSKTGVRNHMLRHYAPLVKKEKIELYSKDLAGYLSAQQDRRLQLRERTFVLQKLMYDLAADSEGCNLEDKRKNADVIKKLSDGVTGLEDKIQGLDKSLEPVEILIERLGDIFSGKMKATKDDATKTVLMDILAEIQAKSQDLFTEEDPE